MSDKPGERIIDKPELPAQGITNENDITCETVEGQLQLKAFEGTSEGDEEG